MLSLHALFGLLGELVAPTGCAACDAAVDANVLFCPACAASALRAHASDGAFAYGGAVADAVLRFKFGGRADLGARLARSMLPRARALAFDVVVPVPLHPQRLAARGYNQSALLARAIARDAGRSFAPRALERLRETPMQSTLDRAARLRNLTGAFRAQAPKDVRDRTILLVDDVRTTGSTLAACANALHEVGARRVFPLVLACRDELAV